MTPKIADIKLEDIFLAEQRKTPVVCLADVRIRDAAELMRNRFVGSIIVVNGQQHPVGIVTDKDLRNQVATGRIGLEEPVSTIMSTPVFTVEVGLTVAEVQIQMLEHRIHHLCLTQDGTRNSPVTGILSEHDLLVLQSNNPAVLVRELQRSSATANLIVVRKSTGQLLQQYLRQDAPIGYVAGVITAINHALFERAVELSMQELKIGGTPTPDVDFCWLVIGSAGRGEQLLLTDQDNALLFDNVPPEEYDKVKKYFLRLADKVNTRLHACGFEYCPAGMMARNTEWCLSLGEWKARFSKWIAEPTPEALLHASTFADMQPVFGTTALAASLNHHIADEIRTHSVFLNFLAGDALKSGAPLRLFGQFRTEPKGEQKGLFDLKARGMLPLADAARVLTLASGHMETLNTIERFEALAEAETTHRELYELAADAYAVMLRIRTEQGIRNHNSGRYIRPLDLSKMERLNLKSSFQAIKAVQALLRTRYQTDMIR
ncbi:MAG: CBS domain-containing protein [Bacteroidetes bacterium]|nr:MAG: CBS domain-containing protein [Bacteroidota bacterium]